jgi:hypothetical protein
MSDFTFDLYTTAETPADETETLSRNTEHAEQAIAHLIEFFRNGPRNQAFLRAVCEQITVVENLFFDLYSKTFLDTAEGVQLDQLGEIVGEARQDRTDDQYRAAIRIRVLVNRSSGKTEELLEICRRFVADDPSPVIIAQDVYPAGVHIEVQALFSGLPYDLQRLLRKAKSAGVRMDAVMVDRANAFIWDQRTDGAVTDAQGWGNRTQTSGGVWAAVR